LNPFVNYKSILPTEKMEGQGVTNYSFDKPSYAFTTATTEFDDELIRRGIVTMEQAMTRKGASASEAQRLAAQSKSSTAPIEHNDIPLQHDCPSEDDSLDDDDEEDEFLQNYRQQRLAEWKQEHAATPTTPKKNARFGQVIPIQRPEWKHHVNDASHECWVVVTLTSSHTAITGSIEAAVAVLAPTCPSVKFVTIPSTSAIAHWPDSNLPSMFVYKDGTLQQELIQMKRVQSPRQVMEALALAGVEFESEEIRDVKQHDSRVEQDRHETLQRRRQLLLEADEEDDDDEVI
jgi:Phosducin